MVGDRLTAGQGSELWTRQTGKEMETVSCPALLNNSRCLHTPPAKKRLQGKTVAKYWQPVTTVQYISVYVGVCVQLISPPICVCTGRPGQRDRNGWWIRVISCLCKNKLNMVMIRTHTHTHIKRKTSLLS